MVRSAAGDRPDQGRALSHQPGSSTRAARKEGDDHPLQERHLRRLPRRHHAARAAAARALFGRHGLRLRHGARLAGGRPGRAIVRRQRLVSAFARPPVDHRVHERDRRRVVLQRDRHRPDRQRARTDPNYTGTIAFTSTDTARPAFPGHYTFTTNDAGSHTFAITLKTAGTQSIAATDTASATVTGTLSGLSVSPAAASQIVLSGPVLLDDHRSRPRRSPSRWRATPYGNLATGYTGTAPVHQHRHPRAGLPASYAFQARRRAGSHTFNVTFNTAGTESITVTDSVHGLERDPRPEFSVALPAPTFLGATVISSTQINLSWTGSTGATGYQIQESTNGTTGWTQVGTTAAGVTTFQSTGLTAGTTYYYRVFATTGTVTSAASNVANATTSGTTGGGGSFDREPRRATRSGAARSFRTRTPTPTARMRSASSSRPTRPARSPGCGSTSRPG